MKTYYYTSVAIGRALGLPEKKIKELTENGTIKRGLTAGGLYLLPETANEIIAYLNKSEEERETVSLNEERARFLRLKRREKEWDLQLRERTLIPADEIEVSLNRILSAFKARMLSIPARVTPQLSETSDKVEIATILKSTIKEALEELSDFENVLKAEEDNEDQ